MNKTIFLLFFFIKAKAQYTNLDNYYLKDKQRIFLERTFCTTGGEMTIKLWNGESLTFLPFSTDANVPTKKELDEKLNKLISLYHIENVDSLKNYLQGLYAKKVNGNVFFKNNGYILKNKFHIINEDTKIKLDFAPSEILTLEINSVFYVKYDSKYYLFILYRDQMAQGSLSNYGYGCLYVFNLNTDVVCNYAFLYDFNLSNSIGIYGKKKYIGIIQLESISFQKDSKDKTCRVYSFYSFDINKKKVVREKFWFNSKYFVTRCN